MTSHIQAPDALPEGTALPPPRPFGDAGTLTLPRRRRATPGQGGVLAIRTQADDREAVLSASIMRTDGAPLTITF